MHGPLIQLRIGSPLDGRRPSLPTGKFSRRDSLPSPWWAHLHPFELVRSVSRHRTIIQQFAWRDLRGRYQGSYLGLFWSIITPLLMLVVYTFVFQYVMRARWGVSENESSVEFAITLYGGLILFNLFAETCSRSPHVITGHANLVKKVVFPLETLPVANLLSALVQLAVGLGIVTVASCSLIRAPGLNLLWLPIIIVPYLALVLGLAWILASLGVFFRDLGPSIAIGMQLLVFLTPVFYPIQAVPERWRFWLTLNPLATYVDSCRRVLLWNQPPDWLALGGVSLASLLVCQLGYIWFMRTKRAFADVV